MPSDIARYIVSVILPVLVAVLPFFSWQILKIFELEKRVEVIEVKQAALAELKPELKELKEKIEEIRIRLGGNR